MPLSSIPISGGGFGPESVAGLDRNTHFNYGQDKVTLSYGLFKRNSSKFIKRNNFRRILFFKDYFSSDPYWNPSLESYQGIICDFNFLLCIYLLEVNMTFTEKV